MKPPKENMNAFDNLLLFLEKPPFVYQARPREYENFEESLNKILFNKYPIIYCQIIHSFDGFYSRVLRLARQNKLIEASEILVQAESFLESLDEEFKDLIVAMSRPVKAYYEYKHGHYAIAESLIRTAFDLDATLESQGFDILVMHRVQVLHNLSRIYFRQNPARGFELSVKLLSILIGSPLLIWEGMEIRQNSLEEVNKGLRTSMYFQIFDELILQMISYPELKAEVLEDIKNSLRLNEAFELKHSEDILRWIALNEALDKKDISTLNEGLIEFLNKNEFRLEILKLQMLIPLYVLFKEKMEEEDVDLKERINVYLEQNRAVSQFLKKKITSGIEAQEINSEKIPLAAAW